MRWRPAWPARRACWRARRPPPKRSGSGAAPHRRVGPATGRPGGRPGPLPADASELSRCADPGRSADDGQAAACPIAAAVGRRQSELGGLQQRRSAAAERAAVLEELERRHEGLSAGVKEVLAQAGRPGGGPFHDVFGMVADLFCVSVEVAPLVDVALGQAAQHIVAVSGKSCFSTCRSTRSVSAAAWGSSGWTTPRAAGAASGSRPEGRPGVLGGADRFVETQPRFVPLAPRLLGADMDRREVEPRLRAGPHRWPGAASSPWRANCWRPTARWWSGRGSRRRPDLPPQPACAH